MQLGNQGYTIVTLCPYIIMATVCYGCSPTTLQQVMEDDQEDEEEPQGKVVGGGGRVTDVQSSDDTGIDLRSIPNSHISRTFVTD